MDGVYKEVEGKSSILVHEQLAKDVETLREKLEEAEKNANCDQTVVRLMIKEKCSQSDLNELANELRMKAAVDFDKLSVDIKEKAKSAEMNAKLAELTE